MALPPKPSPFRNARFRRAAPLAVAALVGAAGIAGLWPVGFAAPEAPAPASPAPVAAARPFPAVQIGAASAIVVDLRTGRALFERDADAVRPLASITKLITALVASERLESGDAVTIASATEAEGEGSTYLLPPAPILDAEGKQAVGENGEPLFYEAQEVTVPPPVRSVPVVARASDAIAYALVASSNEAAAALAVAAGPGQDTFVEQMNEAASRLGARTMSFDNPTGLDEGDRPGAVGSARDVATVIGYLAQHRPELLAPTAEASVTVPTDHGDIVARNTDRIVGALPNLIAGKTGLTDLAGGNLAVVIDPGLNQPIAIVVLGSTKEGRFADVSALAAATVAYLSGDSAPSTAPAAAAR